MNIEIVNYDKKFLKEIVHLFTNTIHKTCDKDYTKEQLNAWASLDIDYEKWDKKFEKSKPILVLNENQIIGFSELYDDYIDCFYIHHKYQNKGVGAFLLKYIINVARKKSLKKIKLDSSITAKLFFESFNFKEVKKNYVKRNNQTLVNYSLELVL
jgi:putative acetyltransferase